MYNFINVYNNVQKFRRGFLYTFTETDEPTFLTFSIDFDFDDVILDEYLNIYESPLFIEDLSNDYSAITYLESIKRKPEAERLREFKRLLYYTTASQPWFFQSISGLDKLWKMTTDFSDTYRGKNIVLEIETLESLDLRITYLADLYRKAVYDTLYRRELVPENLRKFRMNIYLAEFRNLRSLTDNLIFNNALTNQNKFISNMTENALNLIRSSTNYFLKNSTFYRYELYFSEFDFSDTYPVNNTNVYSPKMATNKFKIKSEWFLERPSFKNYNIKTEEYINKFINDDYKYWAKKEPLTLDGILKATGTLFNFSKELINFGKRF